MCTCCVGTPSLAAPGTIAAVLEKISEVASLAEGAEVTLEANPTEWKKFKCVSTCHELRSYMALPCSSSMHMHLAHSAVRCREAGTGTHCMLTHLCMPLLWPPQRLQKCWGEQTFPWGPGTNTAHSL